MKKVLIIGASGSTGQLLVKILLKKGIEVVAIVRDSSSFNQTISSYANLQIVETEISEMSVSNLARYLKECDAVLSCLGHNLNFKGMFGHPKRLVTDAIKESKERSKERVRPYI